MGKPQSYRDLIVWQKGIDLITIVYQLVSRFPAHEQYGLSTQLRRSVVSIPSNIAEGQARRHAADFRRFLRISLGSLAEVDTQLVIAHELTYISKEELAFGISSIDEMRRMIYTLISRISDN